MHLADEIEATRARLTRHGLATALTHLDNAESAFARGEWESANSQVRSYVEALFQGVVAIRLHVTLSGGAARKRLEDEDVVGKRQARVVQRFMELAGERGSHAGISDPDHAAAVRLIGLGVALIGLALIPDLVRVEDVFAIQLTPSHGGALPADRHIRTSCPTCDHAQTLAEADVMRSEEGTVYRCTNGCQPIVVVGSPGDAAWQGRGYRLGDHVIRNARDLDCVFPLSPGSPLLKIPASPAALMTRRPANARASRPTR